MDKNLSQPDIKVTLLSSYTIDDINGLYEHVFGEYCPQNFFLSQLWMTHWLNNCKQHPLLATFKQGNLVIGFTFLGAIKGPFGTSYLVNQTGKRNDDQIWIEYNDIISKAHAQLCAHALLTHLSTMPSCYKLIVTNAAHDHWHHSKWRQWSFQHINAYSRRLNCDEPTKGLSKNTKSQISRASKYITKQYGDIKLTSIEPAALDDALKQIARLHIQQWGEHPLGSGFQNPSFVNFHRSINRQGLGKNTSILRFTAGEKSLGFLYYLIENTTVYFYLSAINYVDTDNKFKPGMVMHQMAAEYFAKHGFDSYDFLAGEARYKTSLADQKYSLTTVHLYRDRWYYRALKLLVHIKRWCAQINIQR